MQNYFKKILPKSLFSRFLLILITPVVFSQLIISVIFLEKYTQTILGIISRQMAGEASSIARLLDMNCEKEYIEELAKNMNLNIEILSDSKLKKQGIAKNHKAYRILKNAIQKKGYKDYYINTQDQKMDVYISSNNSNVYKISFARKTLYMKIIPIVLGSGLASSVILLIIAFIFLKNQIRPIKRLAKEADNFGKGIDNETYRPEGAREIRIAGTAFCKMKKSVKDLMNTRMKILAGISHDLRTPLTKMKLQLSLMPKTKETEWLMNDVNMMIKMTESFTLHASEQNKELPFKKNIFSFMEEIVRDYKTDDFEIKISGDKSIEASVKYISLKRAFGNIISNAKKYAKHLYIEISLKEDRVTILFEDDGGGIDIANIETLFLPFKKQNEARTHNIDEGVGLGLSIARDAINAHGGTILAKNSTRYGGACFIIHLPI